MINKRGLSAVVTTLIIILLVLVAVGIVWVVVRNVIEQGAEQIDISTKCVAVDVRAVGVVPAGGDNYIVTLERKSGGGDIGGVKLNIFNSTSNSGPIDFGTTLVELATETQTVSANGVTGATRMQYTVFFISESGTEQLCSITTPFEF